MRAVAYLRVSDLSQVEGHSLDAQERLFGELCRSRGWETAGVYREEGKSAHAEAISKRPLFHELLQDAAKGKFDVVVVHTLDRWSRNLKVTLESLAILGKYNVGLVSITENLDYSTPQGRLVTQMMGSFAEFYSGQLATHVQKGVSERAHKGLHLGGIPFGYQACAPGQGEDRRPCEPLHLGGVHLVVQEAEAVKEFFRRYVTGTSTLASLASWLNGQGLRTKEGRLFTTSSVRGILHNAFYTGKVRHHQELLPGAHEVLVSEEVFLAVQAALKRNSSRSTTLSCRPHRDYLLKGLIRCAHCLQPLWAQTLNSGNAYYREETGSRSTVSCPAEGATIRCEEPDEQVGRIVQAVVLPEGWMDRLLARIHLEDEVKRVREERDQVEQRLKRLGRAYVDGLYEEEGYRREKRALEERLASLIVPGVDAAKEAGQFLEDLPKLWGGADLAERRRLLLAMLDAVYVDVLEEKRVVAIRPKPAFRALFEIATTRAGSGVVLVKGEAPPLQAAEAPCLWWRRGGVEPPVQRNPGQERSRLSRALYLAPEALARRSLRGPAGGS